jgi:uncharacterized protein with beta-barrel porin domain
MKQQEKDTWDMERHKLELTNIQRWIRLILLFAICWTGTAQADLSITSITQTPQNNVPIDSSVTYQVQVASNAGNTDLGDFAIIRILDNNQYVTDSFTSQTCGLDGDFYCTTVTNTATYSFTWTPPAEGTYNLVFEVNCTPNCNGGTQAISTIVGTTVSAPVADAGVDQTITDTNNDGLETVTVDASGSLDPDSQISAYTWYEGSTILGTTASLTLDLSVGVHTLTLELLDQQAKAYNDQVTITVNAAPQNAPVAIAGPDQTVTDTDADGMATVTLDAGESYDADNDITSYHWSSSNSEAPLGTGVTLTLPLPVGTHTLQLMVADAANHYSYDTVIITVQAAETPPSGVANIQNLSGDNQRLAQDELSDSLSIRLIDVDGLPKADTTIYWSVVPADAASLTSASTTTDTNGVSANTFTANRTGTYRVYAATSDGLTTSFQVNPIAGVSGLTTAQRSLASALDNACPAIQSLGEGMSSAQQKLLSACDYLADATAQQIATALQQMLPDEIAAQGRSALNHAHIRNKNILLRLADLRRGSAANSFENISLSIQGEHLPSALLAEISRSIRGGAASADESSTLNSPLSFFINGDLSVGDTETTSQQAGFDFNTDGLTIGLDYRVTDQFVYGGAINYLSTRSDYNSNAGNLDIEGYSLSFYATRYLSEQSFVDGILGIGQNSYDSARDFQSAGTSHHLIGDTSGSDYSLSVGAGYEYYWDNLSLVPQGRINYAKFNIDSYQESSSGSGLNLAIDDQQLESLTASLSASLSAVYSTVYGVFTPYLSLDWQHEFENDSRAIIAYFVNDPTQTTFSVLTDDPDRDYFNLGLGLTATLKQGKSAFLHYEKLLGNDNTTQYSVNAGFRLEF